MVKLYWVLVLPILLGCEKLQLTPVASLDPVSLNEEDSSVFSYDSTDYVASNDVLERAYQLAMLEWTPVNPVPMNGGGYYPKGMPVRGVPYSSVKEINTYLFHDVSYYTFMTAVHNPKSVLYTENLSTAPYHGRNCAPFYGAVCSSAVMYALGINIPYYANQIIKLPSMKILDHQVIDSLRICDIIWKTGHVQMVFGMEHRADTLYRISMFESSGASAHISDYSPAQFQQMWDNGHYVAYRYRKLVYSEDSVEFRLFDDIVYNDDLCPSKGDKSVYRTTDTVTVNVFNPNYDWIVLRNETTKEEVSGDYCGDVHEFYNLQEGIYSVYLQSENNNKSAEISFEVVETDVSYSGVDGENSIDVYFHSSAVPEYVALCYLWGSSTCYPISSADRDRGYITIPRKNSSDYYCKVVFKGEFGRIINNPIRVF